MPFSETTALSRDGPASRSRDTRGSSAPTLLEQPLSEVGVKPCFPGRRVELFGEGSQPRDPTISSQCVLGLSIMKTITADASVAALNLWRKFSNDQCIFRACHLLSGFTEASSSRR